MFKIMLENNVWYYAWADTSEDSSFKEEKADDFIFKLEKVVETKVAYFYTPTIKKIKSVWPWLYHKPNHVSSHLPSEPCMTMTLNQVS